MALKMHRYFKDDENLGAVRIYLDKCRDDIKLASTTMIFLASNYSIT